MSLEAVLKAIEAEGEQRIQQMKSDSEQRIRRMLKETTDQAEKNSQAWIAHREKEAHAESMRILRHAQYEANLLRNQTQNQMIDEALQAVEQMFSTIREEPYYKDILYRLLIEAWEMLQPSLGKNEKPRLEADPRDKKLLTALLTELELVSDIGSLTTHYILQCAGGLNLTSEDCCIVVHNTVEFRYKRALPILRRYLATIA